MRVTFCLLLGLTAASCSPRAVSLGRIDRDGAADGGDRDGAAGAGGTEWVTVYAGPGEQLVQTLAIDAQGQVYAAGTEPGLGPAPDDPHVDLFLAALSTDGARLWQQTLRARDVGFDERAAGIVLPDPQRLALVGHFGANPTENVPFVDVFPRAGGAPVAGSTPFGNLPCTPGVVCDQEGSQELEVAVPAPGGAVVIGGAFRDGASTPLPWLAAPVAASRDGFGLVAVLDPQGPRWGRTLGPEGVRRVTGVAVAAGGVSAVGLADLPDGLNDDLARLVVLRFDDVGRPVASRVFGVSGTFGSTRVAAAGPGLVLAGTFIGTATFGTATFTSTAAEDAFVVGLDDGLEVRWALSLGGGRDPAIAAGIAVASDGAGGVFVACAACLPPDRVAPGGDDEAAPAVVRVSGQGRVTGWTTLAGPAVQMHAIVTVPGGQAAVVAGGFVGTLTVAGRAVSSSPGALDGFVARVDVPGR